MIGYIIIGILLWLLFGIVGIALSSVFYGKANSKNGSRIFGLLWLFTLVMASPYLLGLMIDRRIRRWCKFRRSNSQE